MAGFNVFKRLLGGASHAPQETPLRRARSDLRVLVVDDSPTIRAVLSGMLAREGYAAITGECGPQALALAREQQPDLIFLDIVMPGMNGFAVLRALRALRKDPLTRTTPIVMISGNVQATEQFYVQRFGADGFLKKPFGRAEVCDRIHALVEAGRLEQGEQAAGFAGVPHEAAMEEVALPDADDPAMEEPVLIGPLVVDEPVDHPTPDDRGQERVDHEEHR